MYLQHSGTQVPSNQNHPKISSIIVGEVCKYGGAQSNSWLCIHSGINTWKAQDHLESQISNWSRPHPGQAPYPLYYLFRPSFIHWWTRTIIIPDCTFKSQHFLKWNLTCDPSGKKMPIFRQIISWVFEDLSSRISICSSDLSSW